MTIQLHGQDEAGGGACTADRSEQLHRICKAPALPTEASRDCQRQHPRTVKRCEAHERKRGIGIVSPGGGGDGLEKKVDAAA
ncbi:hypothetical protein NRP21_12255 [Roseomonas pecuniae]|uniref:Uncharacterized protein n=1 Tax=Roseomonas populi TaxID=3121582 RepID=A0ABT1X3Y4_9PROT|nr:hypothetical protein [Roseomonas pecuniae]MCR0982822.1 hypothetical protein [Roseomonas pecuniae]